MFDQGEFDALGVFNGLGIDLGATDDPQFLLGVRLGKRGLRGAAREDNLSTNKTGRKFMIPNAMPPFDFDALRTQLQERYALEPSALSDTDVMSSVLYPKVFDAYMKFYRQYGDVSVVPTPLFLYGMKVGEDTTVEIARGKTLLIRLLSIGPVDDKGNRTVFFKLNGQTRNVEVRDTSVKTERKENKKANKDKEREIGAPLQGMLSKLLVKKGDAVKKNQQLFIIEAMKMETIITAPFDGTVSNIELADGTLVNTNDLVVELN